MTATPARRLNCDGDCGAHIYADTVADARTKATELGWFQFRRLKRNGEEAKQRDDACPDCGPSFERREAIQTAPWDAMSKEERRLEMFLRMNWALISREEYERIQGMLAEATERRKAGGSNGE